VFQFVIVGPPEDVHDGPLVGAGADEGVIDLHHAALDRALCLREPLDIGIDDLLDDPSVTRDSCRLLIGSELGRAGVELGQSRLPRFTHATG